MAASDATEKKRNIGAQLQSILYTTAQKSFLENLLPVWLLVHTNLFIPSRFWTTNTKFDACCQRYVATCGKFLYRCTSIVSAVNYCSRIFSNPSAIYTQWCAQTFLPIFWIFAFFDRNFATIVALHSGKNDNYVVHLKKQSLVKKRWKPRQNRAINGNAMLVRTMHPSNAWCSRLKSVTKNKHHIFAPTACRIVRPSPNFAWW